MKRLCLVLCTATGLLAALPASAQFQKPEDAIKYRKAAFTVMANHFGRIGAMANGKAPFDAKAAAENAALVAELASLPGTAFGPGTDKGETRAKPEIWTESDKFKAGMSKMVEETARLNAAARTGDLAQLKTAFGAAAQTCKSCHDNFRKE
ncbi:c-type cytochrome [Sphaerotilus uruguayifluvii]|uniref:Cytochrome c556 n=1 Tax=Sphaerotilus uruguayifluvii TaxID=2735897 RepID=A0ABX2G411_9BURK|nr:cytochrome c [Leptothrix sp. C29]NRT56481.1 cytochrome c556 [Leptothrix sp. C29]